jgi:hypothetical protein
MSYLALILPQIFVNPFVPLLLSLTAQCGFVEAHKTPRSLPPHPMHQSLALGKIFEFTQKDFLGQIIHQYVHITTSYSVFFLQHLSHVKLLEACKVFATIIL